MAKPTLYSDSSQPKSFLEALQAAVINRYTKPYGKNEPVVYEFTQDRAMLHQYYQLRQRMYQRMYNTSVTYEEDVYDKLSYILIARRGRLCLGGCRMTVREPDEMWDLPLESNEFKLRDLFPQLPLSTAKQAEISRFAIMEDCGDANVFRNLCHGMYEKGTELGVEYLFSKSTYRLARNWRLILNSLGVKATKIERSIPSPLPSSDEEWCVTVSDITPLYKKDTVRAKPAQEDAAIIPEKIPDLTLVE